MTHLARLACVCTLLASCTNTAQEGVTASTAETVSAIVSESNVAVDVAPWGSFLPYFADETHTLKPVLVGVAKIDAGQQVHPAHRHVDEEYLMVTKGRGIWYLNGVETPAAQGDILFAKSWDYHGIKAAADSPLEFVVFKYSGKIGAMPTDPNPDLPEEIGG